MEELRGRAGDDARAQQVILLGRVEALEKMEAKLSEEVKEREAKSHLLNQNSLELETSREDLSQVEEMAKKVATQVETLKVESEAPSRVRLLEEATVNNAEGRKRRLMATAGAAGGACFLVVFGLGWWEMRSRRIASVDEVKKGLKVRVVGALPYLPERDGGLARGKDASWREHVWVESVDAMRTVLLNATRAESLRTLMVTSADSGEGKTSLSAHLAASLGRVGYRTLLIDGDLRNPQLHKLLDQPLAAGLSELLRGEVAADQAVRQTALPGLWLLPAGLWDGLALQMLAQDRGAELLRSFKGEFDFVILDSAPILPVADSLIMAPYMDGVLLSLLRDVSRGAAVQAAQERLEMLNVRLIGAVVNGVADVQRGGNYRYLSRRAAQPAQA
jgi:capsular exopolysaccharide synthesis family protein